MYEEIEGHDIALPFSWQYNILTHPSYVNKPIEPNTESVALLSSEICDCRPLLQKLYIILFLYVLSETFCSVRHKHFTGVTLP